MKRSKLWGIALLSIGWMPACGNAGSMEAGYDLEGDEPGSVSLDEGSTDRPIAGEVRGAPSAEPTEHPELELLFEDRYSETGRILVYEQGGSAMVQVLGRIGEDDHAAIGALLASGLEQTYRELHPELSEAPAVLKEIDRRIAAELEEAVQSAFANGAPVEEAVLVDKSPAAFGSTGCVHTAGPGSLWEPTICRYQAGARQLCQVTCMDQDCTSQWPTYPRDKTFAWNDSSHTADVWGWGVSHPENPYVTSVIGNSVLAPWTWIWYHNFPVFRYSGTNVCLTSRGTGNLGITHHRWKAVIR